MIKYNHDNIRNYRVVNFVYIFFIFSANLETDFKNPSLTRISDKGFRERQYPSLSPYSDGFDLFRDGFCPSLNGLFFVLKCSCNFLKQLSDFEAEDKVMQFLLGLNSGYDGAIMNILAMDPLPSINSAYYITQQIEKQKEVSSVNHLCHVGVFNVGYPIRSENSDIRKFRIREIAIRIRSEIFGSDHRVFGSDTGFSDRVR